MTFHEHSQIVLTANVTGDDGEELKPGDVGIIIHVHPGEEAFVVEFFTLSGETAAIATVLSSQARPAAETDIMHTREFALAA